MDFDKINIMYSNKPEDGVKQTNNTPSADHPDEVQKEIMRFNWGAFLMTWIWAAGNKLWIWVLIGLGVYAIAFIPGPNDKARWISWICQILVSVFLGVKGSEWAWKSKKWDSIEHFKKAQEQWRKWGIVFAIVTFIVGLIIGALAA